MSEREPPTSEAVREFIVARARALGFHRVGLLGVEPPRRFAAYRSWVEAGLHGSMAYLAAPEHLRARAHIGQLAESAKTLVIVALAYDHRAAPSEPVAAAQPPAPDAPGGAIRGLVARYARGTDYHQVIKRKLYALADDLGQFLGRSVAARPCTDSAPVLERDYAERAGLGFTAKNTMLISPGLGSYTLLGELLLDVDVALPDLALAPRNRCGSCRACLDACPTGAFQDAYLLDARRCISYLTIEHRGVIARELRPAMGQMIFGCDICQEVCPFNARAPGRATPDPELVARDAERGAPDLLALIAMGANQRRRYVADTALRRVNRAQLLRNACIALGNAGDERAVTPLIGLLTNDASELVRGHAAWALGQLGGARAREALERARAGETDGYVVSEIDAALRAR